MGRPRKPVEILKMEKKSHKSKAELEERKEMEVKMDSDDVIVPRYLPQKLRTKFYRYVFQLQKLEMIGNVDAELLARYVMTEEQYQNVSLEIMKLNPVKDLELYTKLVTAQNKLFTQCRQSGSDLGLSITSRGKLVIPQKKDEDIELTPEERLFGNSL